MQVDGRRKVYNEINVTPMLDLAYVLLVIFILMATASVQGIKVNLPKASAAQSLVQPKTIAITVTNDGQLFMDAFPVTLADLETRLRNAKASNPDVPIVLKGDQTAQYGKVTEVLDLCRQLDLNKVGLVTGKPAISGQTSRVESERLGIGRAGIRRLARVWQPATRPSALRAPLSAAA